MFYLMKQNPPEEVPDNLTISKETRKNDQEVSERYGEVPNIREIVSKK
jgi:hypothetical protein